MPYGSPGDHPLTDILVHGLRVYSERADALIRGIAALGGKRQIAELINRDFDGVGTTDLQKLEQLLESVHERLAERGRTG